MKRTSILLACAGLATLTGMAGSASAQRGPLKVVQIDVEGGGGTLLVTPEGKSLLLDAGWPGGMGLPADAKSGPTSAGRIVAIARSMGLKRIDYLLVSHYHADHVGGVAELLRAFPVGTVVDHGANMELARPGTKPGPEHGATLFPIYEAAMQGRKRMTVTAGDHFEVGPLRVDVVNAAGKVIDRPLVNGTPVTGCTGPVDTSVRNENDASIGVIVTYGRARIMSMGDTTAKVEHQLACPTNQVGPVDLLIVSHHGAALSSSPEFLEAIQPRVALMGNGATKGGDKAVFERLAATPSHPAVWQLHSATRSPEVDVEAAHIANLAGAPDAMHSLVATVSPDGAITVRNDRNRASATYPRRR